MRQLICLLAFLLTSSAYGVIETYEFSEPELEQRYRQLSAELRCPKCQNQNIADSNAPISQDLRKLLYEQLEEGASDQEILDHMVARYGEFVRYRPRFSGATIALWVAPFVLLLLGIFMVVGTLRSRRKPGADDPGLDAAERQRLEELMQRVEQDK